MLAVTVAKSLRAVRRGLVTGGAGVFLLALAPIGRAAPAPTVDQLPPKVKTDAQEFTRELGKLHEPTGKGGPADVEWVKANVVRMMRLDQYVRQFAQTPQTKKYSDDERRAFSSWYTPASKAALQANVTDLKVIIKENEWVDRKKFGDSIDYDARVLVQYADFDAPFQKEMLGLLKKLYPQGRTNPQNYAYLYDSLAAADGKSQLYGTQGRCAGPGEWKPLPIADEAQVEKRRADVGLEPLSAYAARYASVCR